jgi:hypothetical protein
MRHFDPVRERVRWLRAGDTLAEFIVAEILKTYDNAAGSGAQVDEAIRVLEQGQKDPESALRGLRALKATIPVPREGVNGG